MVAYAFDLYPRTNPKNGARLVRFTKLQDAEYRGEANGTGAGRLSIRATDAEAAFIDPAGMQYVRVVQTDPTPERVVGGFFLESGDYQALTEHSTKLLTFGGAGTLSVLDRAVMWNRTYESDVLGFGARDPYDDIWRLHESGTGSALGQIFYRAFSEAVDPDRPQQPLSFVTANFNYSTDSSGAAWPTFGGEFTAQVGESLLSVAKRLMEIGLYVSINPDTFVLSAWPAATHRRTRTGAAWGANVVRFQSPTDGTVATGNIKSDAKRAIQAYIKRSIILAGGGDVYATASQTSDIVWEGSHRSDAKDAAALASIASIQLTGRSDAGDTVRLRLKLGNDPANGKYLPWTHVLEDDLVTVHTGTGVWDWNQASAPVSALTVKLRPGGDWDGWVDLGSAFSSTPGRQFQTTIQPSHTHAPNPLLCEPDVPGGAPVVVSSGGAAYGDDSAKEFAITVSAGDANRALYVAVLSHAASAQSATWYPDGALTPGTGQAMTRIAHIAAVGADGQLGLYRLLNPTPGVGEVQAVGDTDGMGVAWWNLRGVNQTTANDAPATATGTGTASAVTVATDATKLVLDAAGWLMANKDPATAPTAGAGQTVSVAGFHNHSFGRGDVQFGGSRGAASPSWTWMASVDWGAIAVAVAGTTTAMAGDGPAELVGTSAKAARCDHKHHVLRTVDPTVNDDVNDGYPNTTLWTNTSSGASWVLISNAAGAAVWQSLGGGSSADEKAKVSANDTTAGYLNGKLVAGTNITLTENLDGGNETLTIAASGGSGGGTYYHAKSDVTTAVADSASEYDLPGLSIADVVAGTYLAVLSFEGSNKNGEIRVNITDGANTLLWNGGTTRHNSDSLIEMHLSGVIVLAATATVKARASASAAIGNYDVYSRHLTLIKIA